MVKIKKCLAFTLMLCMIITILPMNSVQAITTVKLNKTTLSMKAGDTYQLKLSGATKVSWTSSDKKVAIVSGKGVVSAIDCGKTTITAKNKKTGKIYKCKVMVKNTMHLDKESVFIDEPGKTAVIKLVGSKSTSFRSLNTKIATIDKNGNITGVFPGTCTVVAVNNVTKKTYKCEVNVAIGTIIVNANNSKRGFYRVTSRGICKYAKDHCGLELNPQYKAEVYDENFKVVKLYEGPMTDENATVNIEYNHINIKYEGTYWVKISGKYWIRLKATYDNKKIDTFLLPQNVDYSSFDNFRKSVKNATAIEEGVEDGKQKCIFYYYKETQNQFSKIIPGKTTREEILAMSSEITQLINFPIISPFQDDNYLFVRYRYADYYLTVSFVFDENNVLNFLAYTLMAV